MKNLFLLTTIAGALSAMAVSPTGNEWQDNQLLSFGKEPQRAAFASFDNVKQALKILPEFSPRQKSLNSDSAWKFHWVSEPKLRPLDFFKPEYDVSEWETIKVPCSWQAFGANGAGGWGVPVYTNIRYPFRQDAPGGSRVMLEPPKEYTSYLHRNPVGSYRRDFSISKDWLKENNDVFLKFDGVDSFYYLWVNGNYVGFSKDSRSPSEFNVTRFLKPGKNTVALEVYRYSDGSYLEDQDMFRLSGIFRNTWVLSRPKERIRDFFATARPCIAGEYNGAWEVNVQVNGEVENISLYDWDNNRVAGPFKTTTFTVADVKPWSAESPTCYKLVIEGKKEYVSAVFGFRVSEVKNGRYYLNGQKIKLKGANRHESDPLYGHYITKARHEQDIRQMKEANCNAVRNAHYPQDDYWYYLCNVEGLYVVDEANVESHGYGYGANSLSHQVSWEKATVDRNMAMVERNKNHPSVVIWSYGNEAGPGENFRAARAAVLARDTTRPTHYERDWSVAEMDGCQYPAVAWCWQKAADARSAKPFYISEYAHNMGNAMGNLKDYQDAIESSDVILGATIWDWVDQGLYKIEKGKPTIIAYGGDFGDQPNDGFFVMNGCVLSDRTPKPAYAEIKHVFQNYSVKEVNYFQRFVVKNKNYFVDSSGVELFWTLLLDGEEIAQGEVNLRALGPQKEATFDMPREVINAPKDAGLLSLRFSFIKDDKEIANDQIDIVSSRASNLCCNSCNSGKVETCEDDKSITFKTDKLQISFCKKSGMPFSIKRPNFLFGWTELLKEPLTLDAYRSPSSNEMNLSSRWRQQGLQNIVAKKTDISGIGERTGGFLTFTTLTEWQGEKISTLKPVSFAVATRWTISPEGKIICISKIRPLGQKIELARIGYSMKFAAEDPSVQWLGRGPFENYPDRKSGAFLGKWELCARDFFFPYGRPEDTGNREDVQGVNIGGLTFRSLGAPFSFSICPWSPTELEAQKHPTELPENDSTYFGIFAATRGLGGASCGPGPMERDIIRTDRDYDLSFVISWKDDTLTACTPIETDLPALPERIVATGAKILMCSSREPGEGEPEHIIDGDVDTIWHTQYGTTMGNFPHVIAVELKEETTIKGLLCFGRANGANGRIKDCMVETSLDGVTWVEQAKATLKNTADMQEILFYSPVLARYYRFTALNNHAGDDFASMAEIEIIK